MEDEADKEKAPEPARPVASPALVESQASVFGMLLPFGKLLINSDS